MRPDLAEPTALELKTAPENVEKFDETYVRAALTINIIRQQTFIP